VLGRQLLHLDVDIHSNILSHPPPSV
jgi:hypothetical protein